MRSRSLPTRLVVVLATTAAMLVSVAGPALASDVIIRQLAAVCAEDGSDGIAFSVGTDRAGEAAEHPAIRVEWKPAGLDDDAYAVLGTGQLSADNGYTYSDTVTGLDFGDASNVTVRATALKAADGGGPWGDGRPAGDTYTKTISVDDCGGGSDGDARINFTAGCTTAAGEPAVILFNDGTPGEDDALQFEVEAGVAGHTMTTTRTVEPGESTTVLLTFTDDDGAPVDTEDTTVEVAVTVGTEVHERSIDVDCLDEEGPSPDASAEGGCSEGAGAVVVELDNPTDAAVTFVVTIDGEVVDTVELAAGSDDSSTHAVDDGAHLVTVEADGNEVADTTITVDCQPDPSAAATSVCFDLGVVQVELTNPDAVPAQFSVLVDDALVELVEVAGGTTAVTHTVDDGVHQVVVLAGETVVLSDDVTVDCAPEVTPAASADVVCEADGGRVVATVDNPGDALTASLALDGVVVDEQALAAGELGQLVAAGLDDGVHDVAVTAGDQALFTDTALVDCAAVLGITETNDPTPDASDGGDEDPLVLAEQLPGAGAATAVWVLLALLLLFLGGDLVLTQLHARWRRVTG